MSRSTTKIGDKEYEDMGDELPETRCIGYFLGWVRFVKECERGYDAGIEEYFHDLNWRSILENQLEKIPDSNFKIAILIYTKHVDEDFKKLYKRLIDNCEYLAKHYTVEEENYTVEKTRQVLAEV
mgnify:CR=1 FL=1